MIIRPSAALRNDYAGISELAKSTSEPIFITKNGEGDLVLMSIEAYERREQMLALRDSILKAEEERLAGAPTINLEDAWEQLRRRADEMQG